MKMFLSQRFGALTGLFFFALVASGCGGGGGGSSTQPRFSTTHTVGADHAGLPVAMTAERWVTSSGDSGTGTLREALAAAQDGDAIVIARGLSRRTLKLNSTLSVGKNVTIDATPAPGFTVNGQNAVRLFDVAESAQVTFRGLRLREGRAVNGHDSPGGAINTGNNCRLTIQGCTFEENVGDRGGAVRANYGTPILVEDCTFTDNDGSGANNGFSAGGVSTSGHGSLTIRRSRFIGNRGSTGGAVYNSLEPVDIEDCVFINNVAKQAGGAIFTDEGNWAGPSATVGGHLRIKRCWIQGNRSTELGGGMFLWANKLDEVLVEDTVLLWNRVDKDSHGSAKGGGLRTRGILTLNRVAFIENTSAQQGGGLWVDGAGKFEINDCAFSGNVVTDDAGGGATFNVSSDAEVNLRNCTFADNFAKRACGAFWFGNRNLNLTLTNCVFSENLAGSDHKQDQVSFIPLHDGGGNIQFPAPINQVDPRIALGSLNVDPLLGVATQYGKTIAIPLTTNSPAIGHAVTGATTTDIRGVSRGGDPDSGAFEATADDLVNVVPTANG